MEETGTASLYLVLGFWKEEDQISHCVSSSLVTNEVSDYSKVNQRRWRGRDTETFLMKIFYFSMVKGRVTFLVFLL